jgi:hypothetical protein
MHFNVVVLRWRRLVENASKSGAGNIRHSIDACIGLPSIVACAFRPAYFAS